MMQIMYHWHYLLTFVPSISSSLHNTPEQNIPLINIIFLSRNNIYYYINYTTWKTDDVRHKNPSLILFSQSTINQAADAALLQSSNEQTSLSSPSWQGKNWRPDSYEGENDIH